jgi:hypothetical protein
VANSEPTIYGPSSVAGLSYAPSAIGQLGEPCAETPVALAAAPPYPGVVSAVESHGMNSNNLTKAQAKKMHAALLPTLRYLNRLHEQLDARGPLTPPRRI